MQQRTQAHIFLSFKGLELNSAGVNRQAARDTLKGKATNLSSSNCQKETLPKMAELKKEKKRKSKGKNGALLWRYKIREP